MESSDEESPSNTSRMMEKETQKIEDDMFKAGYRDGMDQGRKEGFQENFDKGYALAFQLSMQLGLLRGIIDALIAKDATLSTFLQPLLDDLTKHAQDLNSLDEQVGNVVVVEGEGETGSETETKLHKKSPEEVNIFLKEKYTRIINGVQEKFIQIYPYGEEQAEKILKSLEQFQRTN